MLTKAARERRTCVAMSCLAPSCADAGAAICDRALRRRVAALPPLVAQDSITSEPGG